MNSTPSGSAVRTPNPLRPPAASLPEAAALEPPPERRSDSAADYRASHSTLLSSIYGDGRPALPPEGSELCEYGPLLGERRPGTGRRLGGIVVPTCRSFLRTQPGLMFAARLALTHGCSLVVVHSREAQAAQFPPDVRDLLGDALVLVDLDTVHESWRPRLESAGDELATLHRSNDVGYKRNLGIMLAARFGWQYLLFLDDDISAARGCPTLGPEHLAHAIRAMRQDDALQAVGWPLVAFDDNSVVGHARPLVGLPQGIFISSGALLLRCTERTAFFPEGVYNEDWLFLLQTLAVSGHYQRALAQGGPVHQQPYDAFCPLRARSEEAGELLGEGLMNLVEDHGPGFTALMSGRYWKRVMAGRRALLRRIIQEIAREVVTWKEHEPPASDDRIVTCMNTALWTHEEITPRKLANYAGKWWQDRLRWELVLGGLRAEAAGGGSEPDIPSLLTRPHRPWAIPAAEVDCQKNLSRSASTTDTGQAVPV